MSSRSLDILCLCTSQRMGGAQGNASRLTQTFRARGYEAGLGFLFEDESTTDYGVDDTFIVAKTRPRSAGGWLSFMGRCRTEIAKRRPRTGLGFHPLANIIGALTVGTWGHFVSTQAWPAAEQSRGTERVESLLCQTPLIAANVAVSRFVLDSFAHRGERYERKTEVIYNEPPPLPPVVETRLQCRAALGIGAEGLVLGCLGRLHEQKNVQVAVRAMAHLPDLHLYLAGEGEQGDMLHALAAEIGVYDRVHFLGAISGADVTRFYRAVDVLLMPSLYEGHPLVMLEAMSQSVPVLAHDIAVMREAGGEAALYLSGDPQDWARQISGLTPEQLRALAAEGRNRAAYFSRKSMADEYLRVMGLPAYNDSQA